MISGSVRFTIQCWKKMPLIIMQSPWIWLLFYNALMLIYNRDDYNGARIVSRAYELRDSVHGMLSQMDPALVTFCEKIAENGGPISLPEELGGSSFQLVPVVQMATTTMTRASARLRNVQPEVNVDQSYEVIALSDQKRTLTLLIQVRHPMKDLSHKNQPSSIKTTQSPPAHLPIPSKSTPPQTKTPSQSHKKTQSCQISKLTPKSNQLKSFYWTAQPITGSRSLKGCIRE